MPSDRDPAALLRERGLRVTPQRRAILGAFSGGPHEHLAADEIHARAAAAVPELGRGTVYATLSELTDVGILAAHGTPDPVRYETNTRPHQHFRCRLCLRLFDVELAEGAAVPLRAQGFEVEQMAVTARGICAECVGYDRGLRAGAARARGRPSDDLPDGIAAIGVDTPVGALTVAATARGLVRSVFDNHGDAPRLGEAIRRRRGGRAARAHLDGARAAIAGYFAGGPLGASAIDWAAIADGPTLRAAMAAPRGREISYDLLDTHVGAERVGRAFGTNPLALFVPCHRITRGSERSSDYVGGFERRVALCELERTPASG
jgi:Fur family transcriptional regulator, stress-responsive regulator